MIFFLWACHNSEPSIVYTKSQLRSASLAIRGTLPSVEEYQEFSQNTQDYEVWIDEFLQSPWHKRRIQGIFANWLRTRVDHFNLSTADYQLEDAQQYTFLRSIGEEVPRLMSYYATEDTDWRTLLESPFTFADDMLLDIWPLESIEEGTGWRKARYTDGRPSAGPIMSNGLWWRYYTTPNNFNRSRAATVAQLFLCADYLSRPIQFRATALLESEDLNEIVRTHSACVGCHSTLDPLAAAFFGFWWYDIYDTAELSRYHPEREFLGESYLGVEMAWFGVPMESPAAIGSLMAQDPRFVSCTARTMAESFWHRSTTEEDFSQLKHIEKNFESSGYRFSQLIKDVVLSESFRAQESRMLSAQQLALSIEELTGFVWARGEIELLENDIVGYRKMLGGVDGMDITAQAQSPSVSRQLTLKRLAQGAAAYWVENDNFPQSVEDPQWEEQYEHLHLRLYAQSPSAQRRSLDLEYWSDIEENAGAQQAWVSLISVMIRDPAFWSY